MWEEALCKASFFRRDTAGAAVPALPLHKPGARVDDAVGRRGDGRDADSARAREGGMGRSGMGSESAEEGWTDSNVFSALSSASGGSLGGGGGERERESWGGG